MKWVLEEKVVMLQVGISANSVCSRGFLNMDLGHSKWLSQGWGWKEVISHPLSWLLPQTLTPKTEQCPVRTRAVVGKVFSWAAHSTFNEGIKRGMVVQRDPEAPEEQMSARPPPTGAGVISEQQSKPAQPRRRAV